MQKANIANPPTLLLAINSLLHLGEGGAAQEAVLDADGISFSVSSSTEARKTKEFVGCAFPSPTLAFLRGMMLAPLCCPSPSRCEPRLGSRREMFPLLERHYAWFEKTQAGVEADSFRWRGATKEHTFASGLDDFPRAFDISQHDRHVDLLSWMTFVRWEGGG